MSDYGFPLHEFAAQQTDNNECPACSSTNITHSENGAFTTLVGWFGGPDEDPNHWTLSCGCGECGQKYDKHWVIASRKVWTTNSEGHVLSGDAGCCQSSYLRPCLSCVGGWVAHSTFRKAYGWQGNVPMQPMYWKCLGCGEVSPDERWGTKYLTQEDIEKARKEQVFAEPEPVGPRFTVVENIGIGAYNPKAITRLTIAKD